MWDRTIILTGWIPSEKADTHCYSLWSSPCEICVDPERKVGAFLEASSVGVGRPVVGFVGYRSFCKQCDDFCSQLFGGQCGWHGLFLTIERAAGEARKDARCVNIIAN